MSIKQEVRGATAAVTQSSVPATAFSILICLSVCHLLNDLVQSLLPAVYPVLKETFRLNFTQIGLITLTYQMTASLLQPLVGLYTDKRPLPYALVIGMGFTLVGLVLVAYAPTFEILLAASAVVGIGSSVFHPEASRMARLASGGQHGLAQSLFQVGGNAGSSLGPLLAAYIVVSRGQHALALFSPAALLAMIILAYVAAWRKSSKQSQPAAHQSANAVVPPLSRQVLTSLAILLLLVFSKYFYLSSITSYYTFYLIHKFHVSVQIAQIHLFAFLGAVALGTIIGGPIGDRIGRKAVIWVSILGILPFTLLLPSVDLFWTGVLSVVIGFVLASAFSAIIVFAQELAPGRVGLISGLFFGTAFGVAGIGAAVLGHWADRMGIEYVYRVCAFLPAIGILAAFLPNVERKRIGTAG